MKKLLTLALAVLIILQCSNIALAADSNQSEGYYSEKKSRTGIDALNIIEDTETREYFKNLQESNRYEVVSATEKMVYIIETLDDDGSITESRLMTKNEAIEYKSKTDGLDIFRRSDTWVGDDGEEHQGGKLSIYLVVYKDSSYNYFAYGTADWENGIYAGGVNGPSSGYDFIALTWGGGGELKNPSSSDRSISGEYQYDQGGISFSRAQSDTYYGYCWQFNDTTGSLITYFADYIDCYAKIAKTYSTYRGKETNIRLTYIHTYQAAVGSVSFEGGSSGVAAGVSLSSCDKQWQIEVDIPGIYY